jgi:ribonuclease HII
MPPTAQYEAALFAQGHATVAGVDEAGRGCWAGPVVAAAVVLKPAALHNPAALTRIDDSKQLSAAQREHAYQQVIAHARAVGVSAVPAFLIDAYGILPATRLAMSTAILGLTLAVDALLIDALTLPDFPLPQVALIKGDAQSFSIAAASIVAKVTRDRLMQGADLAFPAYGFAAHKGYGTAAHQRALTRYGATAIHRRTFKPVLFVEEH